MRRFLAIGHIASLAALALVLMLALGVASVGHPARVTADDASVMIANFAFSPQTITVSAGDTVTWTNTDQAAHTVTANDGSFDSGLLSQGQSFSQTFSSPGTYSYICSIHPFMTGTVVVVAPSTEATTPAPAASVMTSPAAPSSAAASGFSPSFTLSGMVANPATFALADLQALPSETEQVQFRAGSGMEQHTYQGVNLYDLLTAANPQFDPSIKNDKLN